jgi:hypothetical protein
MFGEIVPSLPEQMRSLVLHDPEASPIDLVTNEAHIDTESDALLCKQRISLKDWATSGTLTLRVQPDHSSLYGYSKIGHEPGLFFTLDDNQLPHKYTVAQIFPFNPAAMPVDQRPADILDWKSTGRLVLDIRWGHDDPYENYDDEDGPIDIENSQEVDGRIGELPIAIKIGRVVLMAIPDREALILQQGYRESTSYEKFVLYGKTDYFIAEPNAPDPWGYMGAEVIVPMDLERLKSAQLLFLNTQLTPMLSKRTNLGLPPVEFIRQIVDSQTPQLPA